MSKPIVLIVCMDSSSESWEPQLFPQPWHSRAGGGAVHSIRLCVPPWGPHVRFRRVQTFVREGSRLVKLSNSASKVQSVEMQMRLECGVGASHTRGRAVAQVRGQLCADIVAEVG